MFPPRHLTSRYLTAARRAHLARLAAAGALVVIPSACGTSDADTFASATDPAVVEPTDAATTSTATTPGPAAAPTSPTDSTSPSTPVTATAPATSPPTPAADSATFPAGAEVVVEFTYAPTATSGRVPNPYVAVWVEDTEGNLVRTISVWFEQSQKGTRWLNDLRQWSSVAGNQIAVDVTGATRQPGSYALVWDGTDDDGNPVALGDYVLAVESAREHGPYHVTTSTITLTEDGFETTLPDDGELVDLTATMLV